MAIEIPGVGPVASDAIMKKMKTQAELTSAGAAITIPVGSTLDEALQIILDAVDPAG